MHNSDWATTTTTWTKFQEGEIDNSNQFSKLWAVFGFLKLNFPAVIFYHFFLCSVCHFWRVSHSVAHKHELWIWFTLSYAMMKALLRLAAVRDTKQPSELRGDTVQFIASSSALVLMTQNGNIYRPLTQTATCLFRLYSSNISQKTVNGSGRRQLAHGTTDEKISSKVLRDREYMHRKASRKTHSTNGVNIESRVT